MVINKLLGLLGSHGGVTVELSSQITLEGVKNFAHQPSYFFPGLTRPSWIEWEKGKISSDTDSCGNYLALGLGGQVRLDPSSLYPM